MNWNITNWKIYLHSICFLCIISSFSWEKIPLKLDEVDVKVRLVQKLEKVVQQQYLAAISASVGVTPINVETSLAADDKQQASTFAGEENVSDDFSADNYTSGTGNWASDWIEVKNGGSASDPDGDDAGFIQIVSGRLRFAGISGADPYIFRTVDLSDATTATFTFTLASSGNLEESGDTDEFQVQVSTNGSTWSTLETFQGDGDNGNKSYNISGFASATTSIRFGATAFVTGTDEFYFIDDVAITATYPTVGITAGNLTCSAGTTEISGTVFEDFNYNGIYDNGEHLGVKGMPVTATDSLNNSFSAVTDATGAYTIAGLSANRTYRIEFIFPDSLAWAKPTFFNGDNGTTVQFLQAGNCANLGVASPQDYCQENPDVALACYLNGSGAGRSDEGFITFKYNNSGIPAKHGGTAPNPAIIASIDQLGSAWGAAYDAKVGNLYVGAFLKRHVGFSEDAGSIFVFDKNPSPTFNGHFTLVGTTANNTGQLIDLGTINRSNVTGSIAAGAAGDFQLSNDPTEPNRDLDAFGKMGKMSFGDLEMDDAGFLWVVKLTDRKESLLKIDISNGVPTDGSSLGGSLVEEYFLSDFNELPTCTNGKFRPWAITFEKGVGYLGGICSGENGGTISDVEAFVFSFDPTQITSGFQQILNFDLDYVREPNISVRSVTNQFGAFTRSGDWSPWIDNWNDLDNTFYNWSIDGPHPQPILSNIEFANNGDMVIGLMDRFSQQGGGENFVAISGSNDLFTAVATGDILHFCKISTGYTLEGSAGCADADPGNLYEHSSGADGVNNSGEYYFQDDFFKLIDDPGGNDIEVAHYEISLGPIAISKAQQEVISVVFDPINGADGGDFGQNGIQWYNLANGAESDEYLIVDDVNGGFGKASGLGDMEFFCEPAPIEIGNYVWIDINNDGIQDAGESGIADIRVELYDNAGNLLAFDTTDAQGQYYFSGAGLGFDRATWLTSNDTLQPNTGYYVVVGNGQYNTTDAYLPVNGENYELTIDSTSSPTNRYEKDSDGTISSTTPNNAFNNLPATFLMTGDAGAVDHSFDFGFKNIEYDFGDLPDLANGTTGTNDYETTASNGGPSHRLVEGLFLGAIVDAEADGFPNALAQGDDTDGQDDEDGVTIAPTLNVVKGGTIRLPLSMTNTTGNPAYLEAWIDWNGDGDFDDANEMVSDVDIGNGTFNTFLEINIPDNAVADSLLGFRVRFSNTNNMTPYGQILSGEIEDYLIGIECPSIICIPANIEINRE